MEELQDTLGNEARIRTSPKMSLTGQEGTWVAGWPSSVLRRGASPGISASETSRIGQRLLLEHLGIGKWACEWIPPSSLLRSPGLRNPKAWGWTR